MMKDKTKAGEYEFDGGAHYGQLNDEITTLRDQLLEKDKEIERLQEELKDLRLTAQLTDGPQTHDG